MPAIISHHIFGEDAAALLPSDMLTNQEDLLAFLLGNQGTDPLWARFRTTPAKARTCHELADRVHDAHMVDVFIVLHDAVKHMNSEDAHVARAYTLGLGAHYVLDSLTHPLVLAQQAELAQANDELVDADKEVHALLESDIDTWLLWQKRHMTVLDAPCSATLATTEHINTVAGTLLSKVASDVYDIEFGAAEFGKAISDYALFYRLIDPPASRLPRLLARLERIVRPHSRLQAQAHRVTQSDECESANLKHHRWRDPATGAVSLASFADLFHDALIAWPAFWQRLADGDRDRLAAIIDGINYCGRPSV